VNLKRLPCLLAAFLLLAGCASTRNQEPETIVEEKPIERAAVTFFTDDPSGYFASAAEKLRQEDDSLAPSLIAAGENAAEELRSLLLSGAAPDAVWLSPENDRGIYRALKEDGALYALDSLVSEEARAASSLWTGGLLPFYDGMLSAPEAVHEGKTVGLPMTYETAGLLIKQENLPEAGLPANLEALLALDKEDSPALFGYPQDFPACLEPFALPYFAVSGGKLRLSAADWTEEDLASGETNGSLQTAAEKLAGLAPCLYTAAPQADLETVYTAFAENKLLFMPGDEAAMDLLRTEYAVDSPILLAAAPTEEAPYLLCAPTSFLYLPAAAQNPEAAMRWVSLALGESQLGEMADKLGFLPPLKGSASHLEGYAGQAAALLENGATAYCGSFAKGEEETELFNQFYLSLSELLNGDLTAGEWAEGMREALSGPEEETAASSAAA
jgi:ABC-type glycerol-3-phosphate transport system substrate-binding protein